MDQSVIFFQNCKRLKPLRSVEGDYIPRLKSVLHNDSLFFPKQRSCGMLVDYMIVFISKLRSCGIFLI